MSSLPRRLIKITDKGTQAGVEIDLVERRDLKQDTPYAIISHRCTPFDVTHSSWKENRSAIEGLINAKRRNQAERRDQAKEQDEPFKIKYDDHPGQSKVAVSCLLALQDSINHIWLDGPCINKHGEDGNEFKREIASMYRYYRDAEHCYVLLNDVSTQANARDMINDISSPANARDMEHDPKRWRCRINLFKNSEWFTRGWTLQELLASGSIKFYDHHWNLMGDKQQMIDDIVATTGIHHQYLNAQAQDNIGRACTAVKMSWAANRTVNEGEEMAYCLLGLFELKMPEIPGEGEIGFMRLQQLIVDQRPFDESIFAWYVTPEELELSSYGLLAPWVSCFRRSGNVTISPVNRSLIMARADPAFRSRGAGVDFNIPMDYPSINQGTAHNTRRLAKMEAYNLGLNCWLSDHQSKDKVLTIRLYRTSRSSPWRRQNVNCLSDGNNLKTSTGDWKSGNASYTQPCHVPNSVSSNASETNVASRLAAMVKEESNKKLHRKGKGPPPIDPLREATNHISQPKGIHAMAWQGKQYATETKPWSLDA